MYNCYITVDLTTAYNAQKIDLDITEIENYFKTKLREVCVCHLVARITTETGISLELYIDDIENAVSKFNELEVDAERLIDFDCEINDDEDWENVEELLN